MEIKLTKHECIVTRESGDRKYYHSERATAESHLLYHIKQHLIDLGFDVIKKRMWKDGHLVDEQQQYIRTRDKTNPSFAIYNAAHQLFDAGIEFNEGGTIYLTVVHNLW